MKHLLVTAAAALLASCATAVPPQSVSGPRQTVTAPLPCPILSSSKWRAWVSAMPGPDAKPQLIVTGDVTVPTGGYTFAWRDLKVMESSPVQVLADLEALAPEGAATQAVGTHELRGEWPISPPVGSVTVRCGEKTLARISPVETAQ